MFSPTNVFPIPKHANVFSTWKCFPQPAMFSPTHKCFHSMQMFSQHGNVSPNCKFVAGEPWRSQKRRSVTAVCSASASLSAGAGPAFKAFKARPSRPTQVLRSQDRPGSRVLTQDHLGHPRSWSNKTRLDFANCPTRGGQQEDCLKIVTRPK